VIKRIPNDKDRVTSLQQVVAEKEKQLATLAK